MGDANDQHILLDLTVKNRVAGGFDFPIAEPNSAGVAPEIGKLREHGEGFTQAQNISFADGETQLRERGFGDGLDISVGLA